MAIGRRIHSKINFEDTYESQKWAEQLRQHINHADWKDASLENSWANVGGATDETASYKLLGDARLLIKGLIDTGTKTDGTTIFTLPEGYRPEADIVVGNVMRDSTTISLYKLNILTTGAVNIYGVSGATSPELSLHCMVYLEN